MRFLFLLLTASALLAQKGDWAFYGGDAGGQKFSDLKQIHAGNVSQLKQAWVYHTGDIYEEKGRRASAFEATPLYLDGTLFLSTPFGRVIALDPLSGKERWTFNAKANPREGWGDFASRGVSTWVDSKK